MIKTVCKISYTRDDIDYMKSALRDHGLHDWSIKITKGKATSGNCRYAKKRIDISVYQTNGCFKDTFMHELAHAITPGAGHGPAWVAACKKLGVTPIRVEPVHFPEDLTYVYACSKCKSSVDFSIGKLRKPHIYISTCCRKPIELVKEPVE